MLAGQAFINSLANTAIFYNDNQSRPFTVTMPTLRKLIAKEQAILGPLAGPAEPIRAQ